MSKALTKAQLVDQLTAAHAAYERLSAERDALKAQLDAIHHEMVAPRPSAPRPSGLDRRAAMAAAKAEAMRTGRVVRAW